MLTADDHYHGFGGGVGVGDAEDGDGEASYGFTDRFESDEFGSSFVGEETQVVYVGLEVVVGVGNGIAAKELITPILKIEVECKLHKSARYPVHIIYLATVNTFFIPNIVPGLIPAFSLVFACFPRIKTRLHPILV